MNSYKTLLPVSVGMLAFGALIGYFSSKKILEEKYKRIAQEEIDSVKAYYHKFEERKTIVDKFLKPDLHTFRENKPEDAKLYDTEEEEEQAKMDDELSLSKQEEANEENFDFGNPKDPYLISYDEWAEQSDIIDKVDLYYYKGDDILCDAKDSIIDDPEELLGSEWTKLLKDKATAFIRNERLLIDYEIYSISALYSDEVSSRIETDRERKYRRTARAKKAMDNAARDRESAEDMDDDGDKYTRPEKSKKPVTKRQNYDYSKIRNIEEAEELEDND